MTRDLATNNIFLKMERGLLSGNNGQILRDCKVDSVTKFPSVTEIIARDNNKDTTINNAPY